MPQSRTTADVLIVGAGAAGATAAIDLAEAGADVLVLEALPAFGGTAAVSGGGICIAGSALQQQRGLDDSPDKALEDWLAFGGQEADEAWAELYLRSSAPDLFDWLTNMGMEWTGINQQEGNRSPRWHAPKGSGHGLMQVVENHTRTLPIRWEYNTRVVDLVQTGGRVTGVVAERTDGIATEFSGDNVLLASGGFNNNADMVRTYAAKQARGHKVLLGGGRGATGDGHTILERLGAEFTHMDIIWMYPYGTPDPTDQNAVRGLVLRGMDSDIWVNQRAERFHNEALRGGASGASALLAQDPPQCWAIIDGKMAQRVVVSDPAYQVRGAPNREAIQHLLDSSPYVARGTTVAELADSAGLDATRLEQAIAQHNALLASGAEVDPLYGRPLARLDPIEMPPYYAIQFLPLARKNFGGVRTDLECRVLRPDGSAIDGLFAAG
ncbi:MAG: FAD-dependent oxidoreductase, partial [Chloroflexi bacterium]|nr:FAD-dependent oxidoreductase [Chloroflexota bacterium]